jgi:hypothetical protein
MVVSSGVLNFSAELINGMKTATGNLHELAVGNALRMQGAWPHAIEAPGNHLTFRGVGARRRRGPHRWDPIPVQEPKQDV